MREAQIQGEFMTWAKDRLDALVAGTGKLPPIVQTLQLGSIDAWGEGWVRKSWRPVPELATNDGLLFGGYIAALADQVTNFAAMTVIPENRYHRTVDLRVTFLKVGRSQPLNIEGRVVGQIGPLVTARVEFRGEDGALVAEATAQKLLLEFNRPPGSAPPDLDGSTE
jgi:uncharacterized protein (TIGR00369 family)